MELSCVIFTVPVPGAEAWICCKISGVFCAGRVRHRLTKRRNKSPDPDNFAIINYSDCKVI
jgi:hypothetical protein